MPSSNAKFNLTKQIIIALVLGSLLGIVINLLPLLTPVKLWLVDYVLDMGGQIFLSLIKMLVVPIVFVSLVTAICNLGQEHQFGRIASKTFVLYLITTTIAITLALTIAQLTQVGHGANLTFDADFQPAIDSSFKDILLALVPENPVAALAAGDLLQIIIFAILFGLAIQWSGNKSRDIKKIFTSLDNVVMTLVHMIIRLSPYGVFCLIAVVFAKLGFSIILNMLGYFATVWLVLAIQCFVLYPLLLISLTKLSPLDFFRKMAPAMLFAFSTSSSNASIPVVYDTLTKKLKVKKPVAAFVVPLGATINMDGTAIMQGVATVFIANAYGIDLTLVDMLVVVATATLASIGTAGIPSVGLITLTMILTQVGLPVEGIALIIGIDRVLDMSRTTVNITGDATVACIVDQPHKTTHRCQRILKLFGYTPK
jgi:Na+/H+-dicarboxylate symporter